MIPWINACTTIEQQEKLRAALKVAVFASEQLLKVENDKEKLMYVKGRLPETAFKIDIDKIEARVQEIKLSSKLDLCNSLSL